MFNLKLPSLNDVAHLTQVLMHVNKAKMLKTLRIVLALAYVSCVSSLTCLHCTDIQSPRHCKYVITCPSGEVCHVHQKTNEYGRVLFDLGCTTSIAFSNRSHGNHSCDESCSTDLCNSAGCGQSGYPQNRGPICYSCSAQTTAGICNKIDFCGNHEVCIINEEREFGDTVFRSQCAVRAYCEEYKMEVAALIGRSISDVRRSITETTCNRCCDKDLCNTYCKMPIDCMELLRRSTRVSGVYSVRPATLNRDIEVNCDMTTDGGGWTVFQRRVNGSVDFYRNFSSYETGFGDLYGELWLGLKYIYTMTFNAKTELRIDLIAADGSTAYEVFPNFRLSAAPNYTLHVDRGNGTAGDATGLSYHNERRFSTYDNDDVDACAQRCHGAWWFNQCTFVDLNGRYVTPGTEDTSFMSGNAGIMYYNFKQTYSMKETKMMFRRV